MCADPSKKRWRALSKYFSRNRPIGSVLGALGVLWTLLLVAGPLGAQVTVQLDGSVRSEDGSPLPGVTVTARGSEGSFATTTDEDGRFRLILKPGEYEVRAVLEGFASVSARAFATVGAAANVDLVFERKAPPPVPPPPAPPPPPVAPPPPAAPPPPSPPPTSGPPPPPPSDDGADDLGLYWNGWFEGKLPKQRFEPLRLLKPGRTYDLVVDLATLAYSTEETGTVVARPSSALESVLRAADGEIPLTLIAVPDARVRVTGSTRIQTMIVDVERLRSSDQDELPANPFKELREDPEQEFRVGTARFEVSTAGDLGGGTIAISVWADGRPVDELSFGYCLADDVSSCESSNRTTVVGLGGRDSLGGDPAARPDLALHVMDLGEENTIGVLHCSECGWSTGNFVTWKLNASSAELSDLLTETVLPALQTALRFSNPTIKEKEIQNRGRSLITLLFGNPQDLEARSAERRFSAALHRLREATSGQSLQETPSVFVRVLPREQHALLVYPLGLGYVGPDPPRNGFFLGESFRIESSLPRQMYSEPEGCTSRWAVLAPPKYVFDQGLDELRQAVLPLQNYIKYVEDLAKTSGGGLARSFAMPGDFETWLAETTDEDDEPTTILTVSHHSSNQLYYTEGESQALATGLRRSFRGPSVAILVGCGTGSVGASEFVKQFNLLGVGAILATSTEIDGGKAGTFVARVLELLARNADKESYGIGAARWEATKELYPKLGPEVFTFFVAGNGRLRPCVPQVKAILD